MMQWELQFRAALFNEKIEQAEGYLTEAVDKTEVAEAIVMSLGENWKGTAMQQWVMAYLKGHAETKEELKQMEQHIQILKNLASSLVELEAEIIEFMN